MRQSVRMMFDPNQYPRTAVAARMSAQRMEERPECRHVRRVGVAATQNRYGGRGKSVNTTHDIVRRRPDFVRCRSRSAHPTRDAVGRLPIDVHRAGPVALGYVENLATIALR
jgi:hypothetical protein